MDIMLSGCYRVMIVEDELLVAMLIEDTLRDSGHDIVGPFYRLDEALKAARTETVDVALLDVDLRGERVYPVAEQLEARGIPFLLLSGFGADAIPASRAHWMACSKPFLPKDLLARMNAVVERCRAGVGR